MARNKQSHRRDIADKVDGIGFEMWDRISDTAKVMNNDRPFWKQELNALYLTMYNRLDSEEWPYHRYEELNAGELRDIVRGLMYVGHPAFSFDSTDGLRESEIGERGDPLTKKELKMIDHVLDRHD